MEKTSQNSEAGGENFSEERHYGETSESGAIER